MDALEIQQSQPSDSGEQTECINTSRAQDVRSASHSAPVTEKELHKLELAKFNFSIEENTARQTRWAGNCLMEWLQQQNLKVDLADISKEELNQILRQFYGSIRTAKGESYSVRSYLGLRAGLSRYLHKPPLNRSFCIVKDPEFKSANNVFVGLINNMKREGKDRVQSLSPSDMNIIRESHACKPSHPSGLLNKVWLDVQHHFGYLGAGNRSLKKDSFVFRRDIIGRKYCTLSLNEATEPHKDTAQRDSENNHGRMFARPSDSMCPVASLEKYISKLPPDAPAFFLHPKKFASEKDPVWYLPNRLGRKNLSKMLSMMCKEAGTEQIYPNFCLRGMKVNPPPEVSSEAFETISETGQRFIEFPGHFQNIFQELNNQRTQNRLCDCIVAVGNQYFSAHRCVLAAYSSHFRSLLCSTDASQTLHYAIGPNGNMRLLQLDSEVVTPESFSKLLDMMYTSKLLLDMSKITDLLLAASYLHLSTVVKVCKETLNSHNTHNASLSAHAAVTPQPNPPEAQPEAFNSSTSEDEEWEPTPANPTTTTRRPGRTKKPKRAQSSKQLYNNNNNRPRLHMSLASKRPKLSDGTPPVVQGIGLAPTVSSGTAQAEPELEGGFSEFEFEYEMPSSDVESCDLKEDMQTGEASGVTLKAEDDETRIIELKHEHGIGTCLEGTESTLVQMDTLVSGPEQRALKTTGLPLQTSSNLLILDSKGTVDGLSLSTAESSSSWTPSPKVMKVAGISRSVPGSDSLATVEVSNRTTQSTEGAAGSTSVTAETGDAVVLPSVKGGYGPGAAVKVAGHNAALQKPQPVAQVPVVKPLRLPSQRTKAIESRLRGYRYIVPKSP